MCMRTVTRITDIQELLAAHEHKGIDPKPYYWFTYQRKCGTCQRGGYELSVEIDFLDDFLGKVLTMIS